MFSHWILAARPKTLLASFCPVGIGTALAWHDNALHFLAMACALIGAVTIQIGTNFCNDYCDYFQGADTNDRKGPTRAVQAGLISPKTLAFMMRNHLGGDIASMGPSSFAEQPMEGMGFGLGGAVLCHVETPAGRCAPADAVRRAEHGCSSS